MNRISFYQERTFSEKFNVTFEFLKENWKIVLRYITYVCLPMSLVGGWVFNSFISLVENLEATQADDSAAWLQFALTYGGILLLMSLASWWIATVMFSLMQAYNERQEGLESITFDELKPKMKRNAWRLFKLGCACFLIFVVWMGLLIGVGFIQPILSVILVLASIAWVVPLMYVSPVYIYEDVSVWRALSHGVWLGWKTWGGTFALGFVLFLIVSVVQGVVGMPWQICYFVKIMFASGAQNAPAFISSVWFMLISYVASIVMLYAEFLCSSIFFIGISYLYSHAAETFDDMSVETGIDHFEDMADRQEDAELSDFEKL